MCWTIANGSSTTGRARFLRRKKEAGEKEFAEAIETEIAKPVAPGTADELDLEAVETHVRHVALRLAAQAVERRLNADHSDGAPRGRLCSCRRHARNAGRREKGFETVLGPLTLSRAYHHRSHCGTSWFPRDRTLGLEGASLSPAVT